MAGALGDSADDLVECFGSAAAAALHRWAEGTGGSVRLPVRRWRRSGEYTGAVVAHIVLETPSPRGGSSQHKLIAKLCSGAEYAREAGRMARAQLLAPEFARDHLVVQPFGTYPVGADSTLVFQELAGNPTDTRQLSELPPDHWAAMCGAAARLAVTCWNSLDKPTTEVGTAGGYLRRELSGALDSGRSAHRWAAGQGLLEAGVEWGHGWLPSPIPLLTDGSRLDQIAVEYLVGFSHGDLHWGNVLVPVQPTKPPNAELIRFVDLGAFEESAPLTRDLVTLLLSAVAPRVRTELATSEATQLIEFVVTPRDGQPHLLQRVLADVVWSVYRVYGDVPTGWQPEWRAQYLLSLCAAALVHTSFEDAGAHGRRWFFQLAAHAADRFLAEFGAHPPTASAPGGTGHPDRMRRAPTPAGAIPAIAMPVAGGPAAGLLAPTDRLVAPARAALTPAGRMVIPIQRRDSLSTVFLPAVRTAVESPAVVAIYADAGLGKSVLLAQIYDELSADPGLGLVLVSASAKVRNHPTDIADLDRQLGQAVARRAPLTEILAGQRRGGLRPVVLLDTLDLILDDASLPVLAAMLRRLVDDGIPVVLTCRDFEYRSYLEPLADRAPLLESVLAPQPVFRLNEHEVRTFALAYLTANKASDAARPDRFVEQLLHLREQRRAVVEICGSPLLLRLVCQLYANDGIPEDLTVARLYQEYWGQTVVADPRRRLTGAEAAERARVCLAGARRLLAASTTAFTEEFDPAALDVAADPAALDGLCSAGVLVPGADAVRLRFFHQTLAEYAIAHDLAGRPAARMAFIESLREASRGSHLWPVLLQLLHTVSDQAEYRQTVATLDLTEHFVLRAAALSAVSRADHALIRELTERARDLPADHQRHVLEALGSASEASFGTAAALLAEAAEWVPDEAVFTAARSFGGLISRQPGDRAEAIEAAVAVMSRRRQACADHERREQLTRTLLAAMADPLRPYTPTELEPVRRWYGSLGPLGRTEAIRLHLAAPAGQDGAILEVALQHEAPAAAREELIDLVRHALAAPAAGTPADGGPRWTGWRDMLGQTYPSRWMDVQIHVVVELICATGQGPEQLEGLLNLALIGTGPLTQRALHVAERVAARQPARMVAFLLTLPQPVDSRLAGLVRAVAAGMTQLDHSDAAGLLDWAVPAVSAQPRDLLQAAAFVATGHPDLLDRVLGEAVRRAAPNADGRILLPGRELGRIVTAILDSCPATALAQLTPALLAVADAPGARPNLVARIVGMLAPVDATARERAAGFAVGAVGMHARSAAGRAVATAIDLCWFDADYAARLLGAVVPGVAEAAASWIRHQQRDAWQLPARLATTVLDALERCRWAPVAKSLLEVVENDVRAGGPLRTQLPDIIDGLIVRAGGEHRSPPAGSAEPAPEPGVDGLDMQRTVSGGVLLLLRHLVNGGVAPETIGPTLLRAFTDLPMDEVDQAEDDVDRLVRLADRLPRTGQPAVLDQLLAELADLPGTVQLGVAKAVRVLRGENSATFIGLRQRTQEPRVHDYLARRLT